MPYLLHICFDNSQRLIKKRYLFEYGGVQFKLIQNNPRKWADHLLTIVPEYGGVVYHKAFSTAAEFLSALGWANGARIMVWEGGGRSWPCEDSIKKAAPNIFVPPRISLRGYAPGHDIVRLPHIETREQRIALALYREANASNNDFLSFLFFWQVLETGGGDPVGFINKAYRKHRARLPLNAEQIARLPLDGRTLGNYFLEDCRHAIAHIRRRPGKTLVDVDQPAERLRFAVSSMMIKIFAAHYIKERLHLQKTLVLGIRKRGSIPV